MVKEEDDWLIIQPKKRLDKSHVSNLRNPKIIVRENNRNNIFVSVPAEYICSTQWRSGQKRRGEYINKITIEMKEISPSMRLLVIKNHVKHISDGKVTLGYNEAHRRWRSIKEEATVSRNVFIIACETYHGIVPNPFNLNDEEPMMEFFRPPKEGRIIDFRVAKGARDGSGRSALECSTPNVSYGRMWCRVNGAAYEPEFVMAPVTGINANILISGDFYPGDFECFANKIVKRFMLDNTSNMRRFVLIQNQYTEDEEVMIPLTVYPFGEIIKSKREISKVSGPLAEVSQLIEDEPVIGAYLGGGDYGLIRIGKSQHIYTGKTLLNFIEWDNFVPVIDLFAGALITKGGSGIIDNSKLEAGRYVILRMAELDIMSTTNLQVLLSQINVKINRKSLRGNTALKSNITKEKNTATNDSRVSRRF